ncbi:MAG: DUF72 domain-containing protein [Deltaproteobacteria bacterium]|nr:DUF72 domain-containing protein [Deltaproteobacteria bacterium]
MGRILLGTSGFAYPHWRRLLYPEGLGRERWLARYAEVFTTVELNATFYRLPSKQVVDRWRSETPRGFVFACKGSRFLTHVRRLLEAEVGIERFFAAVNPLGPKLGPVLWQLPPRMAPDAGRLAAFLEHLPLDVRHVFEFRDPRWYSDEVSRVLARRCAAFCEHDLVDKPPPRLTAPFRYLRFHGTSARHAGRYGRSALRPFARSLRRWTSAGGDAFAYFNNDAAGNALFDALDLSALVGEELPLEVHA